VARRSLGMARTRPLRFLRHKTAAPYLGARRPTRTVRPCPGSERAKLLAAFSSRLGWLHTRQAHHDFAIADKAKDQVIARTCAYQFQKWSRDASARHACIGCYFGLVLVSFSHVKKARNLVRWRAVCLKIQQRQMRSSILNLKDES
jgi:hypothetical protein